MNVDSYPQISLLAAGTVLRVNCGIYDHVALLGDRFVRGERAILSFCAKGNGLVEETWSVFASGRDVTVDGYLGQLPPDVVMRRARSKSEQPYSWIGFNCEHFVRYAHGVVVESPQLQRWAAVGGMAFLAAAIARA